MSLISNTLTKFECVYAQQPPNYRRLELEHHGYLHWISVHFIQQYLGSAIPHYK